MATRNILGGTEGLLRKKSRVITVFDKRLHQLLDDMSETLREANGFGLAAPQVGVLRRAFIADNEGELIEFVNPKIIWQSSESLDENEGCLSFPGEYGRVSRPQSVTIEAQDRDGNLFTMTGDGIFARCMCHETDHLDGVLFVDFAEDMFTAEDEK